ncbi:MAG: class II aldolase/adducin family protein [Chloroflexi bacterium]|nr:class II aldolase/adducin family protein [Chloroflexota bacterium]
MSAPEPLPGPVVSGLLEQVAELSRRFGLDPQFSRAGGGNSSVKAEGVLFIKPSGVSLGSLTSDALMPLDMEPLLAFLNADPNAGSAAGSETVMQVAMLARLRPVGERRPSVECLFHALVPRRFVLHTHPTVINAVCCARDGARFAEQLFGDTALWVEYVDPGLPLARAISEARRRFEQRTGRAAPDVVLLQNHGLIVAGDDAQAVAHASVQAVQAVRRHLDRLGGGQSGARPRGAAPRPGAPLRAASQRRIDTIGPFLRGALSRGPRLQVVTFDDSDDAIRLASAAEGRGLVLSGPLTPDQIVYAGSWPLWLELPASEGQHGIVTTIRAALADHLQTRGAMPSVVVVEGLGLFVAGDAAREAQTARDVYVDATRIGFAALRLGGIRVLTPSERQFIEGWEAEAYRRGVEAAESTSGRGRGLVILITQASEGLGPALTADLAASGAYVVGVGGHGSLDAVHALVRSHGGLDLVVSMGPEPMADRTWNGNGLLAQVARVWALQRAARPTCRGTVLEVKSARIGGSEEREAQIRSLGRGLPAGITFKVVDPGGPADLLEAVLGAASA